MYINRFLRQLREEGKIALIGKANKAYYVLADKKEVDQARSKIKDFRKILDNKDLLEDVILDIIKKETGIFQKLSRNVLSILDYAFSKMLNNAIEHSKLKKIEVRMKRDKDGIRFDVIDQGIGIFNNIMQKKRLASELEAIQDLLKGKQTTVPENHTGEGIFFTSRIADMLIIQSSKKKLTFNNIIKDVFIEETALFKGTKVIFAIKSKSNKQLTKVFREHSDRDLYEFSKTKVIIKLYKIGSDYISRSQARRVLTGLDLFKTIMLDFKEVETVGQGFADEIFRVWQSRYPDINIVHQNANDNIEFMIQRAIQ